MSPPQLTKKGATAVNPVGLQPFPKNLDLSLFTPDLPTESTVLLSFLGVWWWEEKSEYM